MTNRKTSVDPLMKSRSLSLYIHIPFCVKKCEYCDFLSFAAEDIVKERYVECLLKEISLRAKAYKDRIVKTVFIGGGTPTVISVALMQKILDSVYENFMVDREAEVSMECNPGTVNEDKLVRYHQMGINRLSIGLQSANDDELKVLGRVHDYRQFLETFHGARKAGFDNINIDLMAALPDQTVDGYCETLNKVIALKPEHISSYSLIVEEGTPFYERQEKLHFPTEDEDREMYELTEKILLKNGYHRYEISNYAKDGKVCAHNIVYWTGGQYLGLGLGAASYTDGCRYKNPMILSEYEKMVTDGELRMEECEVLSIKEKMEEFMFLGLRMIQGISKKEFEERFGVSVEAVYENLPERLVKEGLLCMEGDRIRLTAYGIDVSNYVLAQFLLDETGENE